MGKRVTWRRNGKARPQGTWKQKTKVKWEAWTRVVGALAVCMFAFPEAIATSSLFWQLWKHLGVRPPLDQLNLLCAPHQIKDREVLIELRTVLFIEPWQPFLCFSPLPSHLHCHSPSVRGKQGRGIFQRPTGGFVHEPAININRRGRPGTPGVPPHTSFENVPSGVATRLPSAATGFGAFEVGCGNLTAFFDSSKLLQNATNVRKTKGALVAA